jgi:hypothetical protein
VQCRFLLLSEQLVETRIYISSALRLDDASERNFVRLICAKRHVTPRAPRFGSAHLLHVLDDVDAEFFAGEDGKFHACLPASHITV